MHTTDIKAMSDYAKTNNFGERKDKECEPITFINDTAIVAIRTENETVKQMLEGYDKATIKQDENFDSLKFDVKVGINPQRLKELLKLLIKHKDIGKVIIHASTDYPIKFEIPDLKTEFVLAPMVTED